MTPPKDPPGRDEAPQDPVEEFFEQRTVDLNWVVAATEALRRQNEALKKIASGTVDMGHTAAEAIADVNLIIKGEK